MHFGRNFKEAFDGRTQHESQGHAYHANAGVAEQRGVDEVGKIFPIVSGGVLGNVANDGGANAEIEKTVVAGYGEDHHPDPEAGIAQVMQDERRKENADHHVDRERGPARANVFQDLSFFQLTHE